MLGNPLGIKMKGISAIEFKTKIESLFVLDIRTQREWDDFNLGGYHIPLDEMLQRINEISPTISYTLICYNGTQSEIACKLLEAKGYLHCQNLIGGLEAYLSL